MQSPAHKPLIAPHRGASYAGPYKTPREMAGASVGKHTHMSEIDVALENIDVLVKTFQRNESRYKSAHYSEAEARKDFIDKFWIALGWDVNHDQQTNPYEQEVRVEPAVAAGGGHRRADYAFYLAPIFTMSGFSSKPRNPSSRSKRRRTTFN